MKKTLKRKGVQRKPRPELKWQTGDYERHAEFRFILPYQFLLLCRLVDITPEEMVRDFMDNLSCGSWKREGRDKAKEHLADYFIAHGYGRHHYSEEEIREMFREMDALGLLFPREGKTKLLDLYAAWRDKHSGYWFRKWFRKPGRRASPKRTGRKG
ncbi:MAG TPA: hypothetical protein VGO58_04880 [Chitinophagaceae bacterium]|nr:hypothetical protein [Chitinophagaceae bacterium]